MKEQDEKLSLLLDDYSDESVDAVLDEVSADVNLQYRVRRYRMIGEVLRHELPDAIDTGFHQQVMARIREEEGRVAEPAEMPSSQSRPASSLLSNAWLRPFAGLAVAASVAVVTVSLWQPGQPPGTTPDTLANSDAQKIQQLAGQPVADGAVQTASGQLQPGGMRWRLESESPMLQQKLNAYLVNHTEYSSSMQGLIPQARVAGFDAQQ